MVRGAVSGLGALDIVMAVGMLRDDPARGRAKSSSDPNLWRETSSGVYTRTIAWLGRREFAK
jgi:hypothetical protein